MASGPLLTPRVPRLRGMTVFMTEHYASRKGLDTSFVFVILACMLGDKMVTLRVELENLPRDGPQCV